jgi:hypothetical protein
MNDLSILLIISGAMLAGLILGLSISAICRWIGERRQARTQARAEWLAETLVLPPRLRALNRIQSL